jgi:hypothetical protein
MGDDAPAHSFVEDAGIVDNVVDLD